MNKPYYQDDCVTIYCDDFRNAEWLISDTAVLITDPPYGISLEPWQDAIHPRGKESKSTEGVIGDDKTLDLRILFEYPKRLIWGFPYIYDAGATGWLVWDKQPNTDGWLHGTPVEMACSTLFGGFRIIHHLWQGSVKATPEYRYEHPTQKPLKIFSVPIANYTEKGDLIIDLFLGTGTCAVAAKKLNRKFIGYEIEEKYCKIAAERCSQMTFNFGGAPQRDGSAEPEFYQFLLDNKDNPEFMEGVKL